MAAVAWLPHGAAVTLPKGYSDVTVASDVASPSTLAFAPDGRLFIGTQGGRVRVLKNGQLLPTPFVVLTVDAYFERGLLGIAFHPKFATNGWVYLCYTVRASPPYNRVVRYTSNGDVAEVGSDVAIARLGNLAAGNHNGGAIHFGPDGKLYWSAGENAVATNAQDLTNTFGKIHRFNEDGTIPSDNPFVDTAGAVGSIWAYGLRNPFTFAFQPGTGRMHINDVGQYKWEEINVGAKGANFGWPDTEGPDGVLEAGETRSIYAYGHVDGACAITGGVFYTPPAGVPAYPGYSGAYFFLDYCAQWIRCLTFPNGPNAAPVMAPFASSLSGLLVGLAVSPVDGALYYLSYSTDTVHKIQFSGAPTVVTNPRGLSVKLKASFTLTVRASGVAPLVYQWRRGSVAVGADAPTLRVPSAAITDAGLYTVTVSNSFGSVTTTPVAVQVSNTSPTISTLTLLPSTYSAGTTLTYSATARDVEDGVLDGAAFSWTLLFRHDQHTHPVSTSSGAVSGTLVVPATGETAVTVQYCATVTVTDSAGGKASRSACSSPNVFTTTVVSSPSGLAFTLDGAPHVTPYTFRAVVGMARPVSVAASQVLTGVSYAWASWSDGGARAHDYIPPLKSGGKASGTLTLRVEPQ